MDIENHFDEIYLQYYTRLYRFAHSYIQNKEDAESIVQNVFLSLWESRNSVAIEVSMLSYLFCMVKNKCIDYFRHKTIHEGFVQEQKATLTALQHLDLHLTNEEEVERVIREAIDQLPERCRQIFILSRLEGKKYQQIAQELNLSVNTVENQMSIALKKLRISLQPFLSILILLGA